MGLDNTKERLEHQSKSYGSEALAGGVRGFRNSAASKSIAKVVNLGGKAYKIPVRVSHGKLGAALGVAAIGLSLKSLYHQFKAAGASDTPIGTFLKVGFVGGLAGMAGGLGGSLAGAGALASAMKLRRASMAFAGGRAAKAAAREVSKGTVQSASGKPIGKFVFRRIRGRIVRIRGSN